MASNRSPRRHGDTEDLWTSDPPGDPAEQCCAPRSTLIGANQSPGIATADGRRYGKTRRSQVRRFGGSNLPGSRRTTEHSNVRTDEGFSPESALIGVNRRFLTPWGSWSLRRWRHLNGYHREARRAPQSHSLRAAAPDIQSGPWWRSRRSSVADSDGPGAPPSCARIS